jgi:prophage antirepressor-like protein
LGKTKKCIRASDIGNIIGLKTINTSVQNYSEREKVLHELNTLGGVQKVLFLTTDGMYRLLFSSKRPEAEKFRIWASDILDDVNFNNCQEIQKTLTESPPILLKQSEYNETICV